MASNENLISHAGGVYAARSPLKETDANSKPAGTLTINNEERDLKKRLIETTNEKLQLRKRAKLERGRSIEGAVQVTKGVALRNVESQGRSISGQGTVSGTASNQSGNNNNKVALGELLEWQMNWRNIMRRDSRIYFDTTDEPDITKHAKSKLEKRKLLLKCGFMSLGAQITQFFDTSVTIVISSRSIDNITRLNETDILARAKKSYMKVWGYDKAARFLKNLDVDLENLEKNKLPTIASPSLSNLLQNEKLFGPSDRDPRTRRDDIHYFKYPHIYMYDLWQTWAPIITLEWKPQELANPNNLPYPTLKMGTFGRCPFIGDRSCDESSYKRVLKRYSRDKSNKKYALKLRGLYQHHADPTVSMTKNLIFIPHLCLDSAQCYEKWQEQHMKEQYRIKHKDGELPIQKDSKDGTNEDKESEIRQNEKEISIGKIDNDNGESKIEEIAENSKLVQRDSVWKGIVPTVKLEQSKRSLPQLNRQETEEFPDDLCTVKKYSRDQYEIKASGVHQSNDIATSFGNGLGPTRASVMSKNMKSLSRFVVDKKIATQTTSGNNVSSSTNLKHMSAANGNAAKVSNESIMEVQHKVNDDTSKEVQKTTINPENNLINAAPGNNNSSNLTSHLVQNNQVTSKRPLMKNSGYCENCRVKYEYLDQHVVSEKHLSFANNDINFEAIDSLIEKLGFQF